MRKPPDLLKEKIQALEKKLKRKDALLKKYRQSLNDSHIRIKKIARSLNSNISFVREIHKNLIPVQLPHIPGFELSCKLLPAERGVSGDFFDIVKMKSSMSFGALMASCGAYAVSSLFLSSFLKFTPHLKSHKTAKDFLDFVSQSVSLPLSQKEKIHLFYGIISRSSFELDYCLAGDIFVGHKTEGKEFEILPAGAPYLRPPSQLKLKAGKRALQPNDILLLCSPGVAGRMNNKGQRFGAENIIRSAGKDPSAGVLEIRQNVLFACNEFGQNRPSTRDCAVLALKADERVVKALPAPS